MGDSSFLGCIEGGIEGNSTIISVSLELWVVDIFDFLSASSMNSKHF